MRTTDEIVDSADRFAAFFQELTGAFVERDVVLSQIALALLSRQHVLLTGPPGNAKSNLAHAVLGRIVHERTGVPSVFARQFTESTVHTDLVGPINFKTLMDTGRTEHFTDEGILGSVHAFLDEVFDGRDMLLRSTLNLLNERELKQGARTTRGKIECAIMTSNRYLADILENERLLAFVDRVAFLSFVPKGFASQGSLEAVLRAQVAGRAPPPLRERLTIEDVDRLQLVVDDVFVPDEVCVALAELVRKFEAAITDARRADPNFVPSRYLSTRTIVRLGSVLRAACAYEWIMGRRERALEVTPDDLAWLRLAVTLSGPTSEDIGALLAAGVDGRERRQLDIVQIEREAFSASLAALTRQAVQPPADVDAALLASADDAALTQASLASLLALAQQLAMAATAGRRSASAVNERLQACARELERRAVRTGVNVLDGDEGEAAAVATRMANVADELDRAAGATTELLWAGRWLRTQALRVLHAGFSLAPGKPGALGDWPGVAGGVAALLKWCEAQVEHAGRVRRLRDRLRRGPVDEVDRDAHDAAWIRGATALATDLTPVLRQASLALVQDVARGGAADLGWLTQLEAPLGRVVAIAARLRELGANPDELLATSIRAPFAPIIRQAIQDLRADDRAALLAKLDQVNARLARAHLVAVLERDELVAALAKALSAAASRERAPTPPPPPGVDGYRALRRTMPRASLSGLLVELSALLLPPTLRADDVVADVAASCAKLPEELKRELATRDRAYLSAPIGFLEQWWRAIAAHRPKDGGAALEVLVSSRFFEVAHDEGALARFELEVRLVAQVLGAATIDADELIARLHAIGRESAATRASWLTLPSAGPASVAASRS